MASDTITFGPSPDEPVKPKTIGGRDTITFGPAPERAPSALTTIGQHTAAMGAGLAPVIGGAAMGAELGALGGPAAPITVPVGGILGAGVGGLASPAAEYLARRAVGLPSQVPSYAEAAKGALTGAVSEMTGGLAGEVAPALQYLKRAITGEGEIGKAATTAAEEATTTAAKEREKLGTAAEKEIAAGKEKARTAAETAGQKALEERANLYRQAEATRASTAETAKSAQAKVDESVMKAHQRLGKEYEPIAREEVVAGTLPPPSARAAMEAGPERIARGEEFRDTIMSPLQNWREKWRTRRDALLGPHAATKVDDAPLRQQVAEEVNQWIVGNRPFSPRIQSLLRKASPEIAVPTDEELLRQAGIPSEEIAGYGTTLKSQTLTAKQIDPTAPAPMIAGRAAVATETYGEQALKRLRADWEKAHPPEEFQPSVQELVGLQSEANHIARMSKGADRTAALKVVRGIDDTLASVEVPSLKSINAEYRDHRLHFPYAFEDAIQSAARPADAAKAIFTQPERVLDLVKLGGKETQGQLAQLYSDHIREVGQSALDPEVVKALGYSGPLSKPEGWFYAKNAVDRLGEMFDSAPAAKAKYEAALAAEKRDLMNDYSASILKDARNDLAKLGPTGKRIQAMIASAPTQYKKAEVAVNALSNLEPGQVVGEQAAAQGPAAGRAAYGATIAAPREARQALAGYQPAETPEAAAMKAITEYEPKGGFASRWKRRAEFWAPLMLGGLAVGRPSTYAGAGLAMGIPVLAREGLAAAWRQSLRDPATAREFYYALQNPGTQVGLRTLAKYVTQATVMSAMPRDVSSPRTANPRPGPGIKATDQKRAETIAGPKAPPEKVDRVKKISGEVRSGKTPDIHDDLSKGRISTSNVRKMLDGGPPSLASVFEGLSPADSIDVLAKASPEERGIFLPVVAQKIQTEGSKLPKPQQQMLMAQLRRVMQGGGQSEQSA